MPTRPSRGTFPLVFHRFTAHALRTFPPSNEASGVELCARIADASYQKGLIRSAAFVCISCGRVHQRISPGVAGTRSIWSTSARTRTTVRPVAARSGLPSGRLRDRRPGLEWAPPGEHPRSTLDQQDWKTGSVASAARHHVASHFLRCLRLVDAGMLEEAALCLARNAWHAGLDLSGVPPAVVSRTEFLCSRARGLVSHGDPDAIGELVDEIVDLWA